MKNLFLVTTILLSLTGILSCELFASEQKAEPADLPPWPDMNPSPPDKRIKSWIKFDLFGTMNYPFSTLWFSSQKFDREYPNVLIKLNQDEYKRLKSFVQANECEKNLDSVQGDPLLSVIEYKDGYQSVRCIMPPNKACEYMTKMYTLRIVWTEEQTAELRLMGNSLHCEFVNNKFQEVKL